MKHTLRNLLTIATVLCLLVCCLTVSTFAAEASGKCGDNVTWELKDRTLYINGTGPMWDYSFDTVSTYDPVKGYFVNPTPWHTFILNRMDKVVISEGVTHIGNWAFFDPHIREGDVLSLKEIIVPNSVTSIGEGAFFYLTSLEHISLPDGITSIPDNIFYKCYNLKSINIPDSVTEIGEQAFYHCKILTSVELTDNLTTIKDNAFSGCTSISSIMLPDSLTTIGYGAFSNCNLTAIKLPDSLTTIGSGAFVGCDLTSITIPASVTSIGSLAIVGTPMAGSYNESLKTIIFAEGTTSIKTNGCSHLRGLTEVQLPSTLITLDAFSYCPALTKVVIPDSVTSLSGFNYCTGLTEVNIPDSVTNLSGFDRTKITKLDIPDSVIELSGFNYTAITEIHIPDSVTTLSGFMCCTELTELTIPNSVISIGSDAFANCSSLKKIIIPNTVLSIDSSAFANLPNDAEIIFLCGDQKEWNALMANHPLLNRNVKFIHEWNTIEAVDPTCTKDGTTAGKLCTLCDFSDPKPEVIPALGHDFDPYEGTCNVCSEMDPAFVSNPFTDVTEDDWFYKPVLWAKMNNVTGGTSPTTFSPEMGCTRAQVVTFLWAANGKPEPMSMYNPFEDVADEAWYVKPVLWAVENGITGGTSATTFSPDATCTRAQIVTFLYAAQGKPALRTETNFDDVSDSDWFVTPVRWAAENDVTGGIGNNKFGPNDTCTRGQVVTFLMKVYENK